MESYIVRQNAATRLIHPWTLQSLISNIVARKRFAVSMISIIRCPRIQSYKVDLEDSEQLIN